MCSKSSLDATLLVSCSPSNHLPNCLGSWHKSERSTLQMICFFMRIKTKSRVKSCARFLLLSNKCNESSTWVHGMLHNGTIAGNSKLQFHAATLATVANFPSWHLLLCQCHPHRKAKKWAANVEATCARPHAIG